MPLTHHTQACHSSNQVSEIVVAHPLRFVVAHPLRFVVAHPLRFVVAHPLHDSEESAEAGKALPEDSVKSVSAVSLCQV